MVKEGDGVLAEVLFVQISDRVCGFLGYPSAAISTATQWRSTGSSNFEPQVEYGSNPPRESLRAR